MFSCNSLILQFLLQIQSREIHVLCVRSRLHAGASTVLSAEFNQIITRLESSHTHPEDVILNTSKESSSPPTNTSNDGLPDIPVLESPDSVTEIIVPLVSSINIAVYSLTMICIADDEMLFYCRIN